MKKLAAYLLSAVLCLCALPLEATAAEHLIPVGQVVGLELRNDTVCVRG